MITQEVSTPSSNPGFLGYEAEMTPLRDLGDEGAYLYPDLFEIGFDSNATLGALQDGGEREQVQMQPEPMDQV